MKQNVSIAEMMKFSAIMISIKI